MLLIDEIDRADEEFEAFLLEVLSAFQITILASQLLTPLLWDHYAMLLLLPYAILIDTYPNALFKPTAFVIILSAIGAVVAMLTITQLTHKQAYRDMGVITVIIPVAVTLVMLTATALAN